MARLKQEIERQLGRSDWAYVIDTHAHDTHAGGNALFKGIPIIGHETILAAMKAYWIDAMAKPEWRARCAQGIVLVYVPEEKLVVCGGVCSPFFPDLTYGTNLPGVKRVIAAFDRVLDAGVERVVPGHAGLMSRQDLEKRRDYERDLLAALIDARQGTEPRAGASDAHARPGLPVPE
jgi:glyoxylase-like metal-dependent hydrolase (beta-lactamase superfamily II)